MNQLQWLTAAQIEDWTRRLFDVVQIVSTRPKGIGETEYLCLLKEKEHTQK